VWLLNVHLRRVGLLVACVAGDWVLPRRGGKPYVASRGLFLGMFMQCEVRRTCVRHQVVLGGHGRLRRDEGRHD
jgi:hypothetical protein